jgi:hypothetical protein
MGTLLRFPEISSTRRDPRSRDLSQIIPDFVQQLESFQKLAESSLTAGLATTVDRLETALADIDTIGRLLPPGEFKTQFDLDRKVLAAQLDLAKGKIVGLWEQTGS